MNQVKLKELIKNKSINIPIYVLRMYREFNLNVDEIVLLFFLYDKDSEVFNPKLIADSLNLDLLKVMDLVSKIADKGLINVVTKENEAKIKEEVLDLSPLFNKITMNVIKELNEKSKEDINIYNTIEKEFNRKLSPMECEMVDDWMKNNYNVDLICEAIREATLNGVSSLRYIDKILYEWNRKGYKNKDDIKKKNTKEEPKEKVEIFNCDWLETDEEL